MLKKKIEEEKISLDLSKFNLDKMISTLKNGECVEMDYKIDGKQIGKISACRVNDDFVKIEGKFGGKTIDIDVKVKKK